MTNVFSSKGNIIHFRETSSTEIIRYCLHKWDAFRIPREVDGSG